VETTCTLCRLPLNEPCLAVVEVTRNGVLVRKAMFYGLHRLCGGDWSRSEISRLRDFYGDRPDFSFTRRVEVVRDPPWASGDLAGPAREPFLNGSAGDDRDRNVSDHGARRFSRG